MLRAIARRFRAVSTLVVREGKATVGSLEDLVTANLHLIEYIETLEKRLSALEQPRTGNRTQTNYPAIIRKQVPCTPESPITPHCSR